jgi:hypothetical protein
LAADLADILAPRIAQDLATGDLKFQMDFK